MTMDQLRYFYAAAKCLNFSQAARNLYISQPNLTKYIANLEKELGFRLFDRSTHHCRLTEEGQQFLRSTEMLFFQLNSHIEGAKLRAQNPYQVVRIGMAQAEQAPRALMQLLNERNTGSRFRYLIEEDSYVELMTKLQERELDLIVTSDRNVRDRSDFNYVVLRPFDMLLIIHRDNPKAKLPNLSPKDCVDEIFFICIPEGKFAPQNRVEEIFWKTGARLNISIENSPADVLSNTRIGAGVGIVPSTVDLASFQDIRCYRFESWQHTEQALVWRKDEQRPEVLSLVAEVHNMAPFRQPSEVPIYGNFPGPESEKKTE